MPSLLLTVCNLTLIQNCQQTGLSLSLCPACFPLCFIAASKWDQLNPLCKHCAKGNKVYDPWCPLQLEESKTCTLWQTDSDDKLVFLNIFFNCVLYSHTHICHACACVCVCERELFWKLCVWLKCMQVYDFVVVWLCTWIVHKLLVQ